MITEELKDDYNNIKCELFGSSVTGLSLPDSDIDICIVGFTNLFPDDIPALLSRLSIILQKHQCTVFLKEILSAKVPVLKLEIDLGIPFKDQKDHDLDILPN